MVGRLNAQRARSFALSVCLTVAILRPANAAPGQATTQPIGVPVAAIAATLAATVLAGSFSGDYGGLLPRPRKRRDDLHSPSLNNIGLQHLSGTQLDCYGDLQDRLRASLAFDPVFERPAPKQAGSTTGNLLVNPDVDKRLVPVTDDRLAHFDAACACDPPQFRWQKNYSLPPACARAIDIMFQQGPNLGAWRAKQARNLSGIARKARELDKVLKAGFSPPTSVQYLQCDVRDVNVVLLCLMCDALNHPDVNLPRNFLLGFPVTGVVPDSGVLRPIPTAGSEEAFWAGFKRTMATNNSWATTLASAVNSEGLSAHGRRRELLRRSWDLTKNEVAQGFASQPMTLAELKRKYSLADGNLGCRPLRRHGIVQGQKQARDAKGLPAFEPGGAPKMVDKIRLIDDSKASLHNSTLIRCCETIAPCRFTLADETLRQASALGVQAPELVFSLDDMKSAYRQIPTADPEMCIICIYSFDKGNMGPRFVEQHGHKYAPTPHPGERFARKPALPFTNVHATLACTLRGTDTLDLWQLRAHLECL